MKNSFSFDASRRFVRVRNYRPDGFVEFDFAIGDPALSVQLILPRAAFDAFSLLPGMQKTSEEDALRIEALERAYNQGEMSPSINSAIN